MKNNENYEKFQVLLSKANKQRKKLIKRIDTMRYELAGRGITNSKTMSDFSAELMNQASLFRVEVNKLQSLAHEISQL